LKDNQPGPCDIRGIQDAAPAQTDTSVSAALQAPFLGALLLMLALTVE
jgi:hypothetical protein